MELVILGAVGLVGYRLANPAARPSVQAQAFRGCTDPRDLSLPDDAVRNRAVDAGNHRTLAQSHRDSLASAATGVVPFYRSDKNMATSEQYKQDRFELFTGQLDRCSSQTGTYRPKRESGPMFDPCISRMPVTSSGRQAYVASSVDQDRYQPGLKMHGTGPVSSQMVGPGLGLGPDVPAAGGFHPFYRQLPDNTNGYRKNNLPGRIIPGKALVGGGANTGLMNHKDRKPLWCLQQMPLLPTRATVTAPAQPGAFLSSSRCDATEGFTGHAFGGTLAPSDTTCVARGRTDNRFCGSVLGAAGPAAGGYNTQATPDTAVFRNQLGTLPTGAFTGPQQGGFQTQRYEVPCTQREQAGFQPFVTPPMPGQTVRNQTVRQTGRECLPQGARGGGPAALVAAPGVQLDPGVNRDKPDTCVGYMPNGVTANMWNPQVNSARLRDPPMPSALNHGGLASVDYGRQGQNTSCMNKLPIVANLDLSVAKDVLANNPYCHALF